MASVVPTEIYGSVNILTGLDPAYYGNGSLYVQGNLQSDGTLTALNTTDTIIKDGILALNTDTSINCNPGSDGGMWINRNLTDVISDIPKLTGTADFGTLTTITLQLGSSIVNDYYKGWTITITGGTGVGQTRIISSYVGGFRTATVPAWGIAPDATSAYSLYNTTRAAFFYDTSNKEFACTYTVDPHTANPLTISEYANLHVKDIIIGGDIVGFYEIITLIENSMAPQSIAMTSNRGSFFIVVESLLNDGACATFSASNRSAATVGSVVRLTSSPGITGVELMIDWPIGSNIEIYHSVTGPNPTPLQYSVLAKNAIFIGGASAITASNVGLFGVGPFKVKVGTDLQFKNIAPNSSKILITDDIPNSDINIDVNEPAININNLGGTPLAVPKGGTGNTVFAAGQIIQGNGAAALTSTGILASDVVTLNGVQTLTNKTLTSTTNDITAKALFANTSAVTVNVNGPTVPVAGYVLTMTSPTTADWAPVSAATTISYTLVTGRVTAPLPVFSVAGYFPWLDVRYSGYTGGIVIYEAVITGAPLDVQLYDATNAVILGSDLGVVLSGIRTFAVANPLTDAEVQLQIRRGAGMALPEIRGATLEYTV